MHRTSRPITVAASVLLSDSMEKPSCFSTEAGDGVPVLIIKVNVDKLAL